MSIVNQQHLALLKFGIVVPTNQKDQVIKMIKNHPAYKDDFENIKNNIKSMIDQDDFLQTITNSHLKIAEVSQNNKVIQQRQHTFQIRAINPQHIQSLTERAFFNSFNLQRIVMNDLQQQNFYQAQKNKGEDQRKQNQPKKIINQRQSVIQKQNKKGNNTLGYNEDQEKCICGKLIQESYWIQCCNENKCRGSGWYHLECAGVKAQPEQIQNIEFTCDYCKRNADGQKESQSSNKKFKSN